MNLFSLIQEVLVEERKLNESSMLDQPDFASKVAWVKKNKPKVKNAKAYVASILHEMGELDEVSMASGAVEGGGSPHDNKHTIFREEFVEELKLREILRRSIRVVQEKQKQNFLKEQKLRSAIRTLIRETDVADDPHEKTGINVLKTLLRDTFKTLRSGYMELTTSKEQRDSYRAHILNAAEDILKPMMALDHAPESANVMAEEIEVDVEDPTKHPGFIAMEDEPENEESPEEIFGIEGQNTTGRDQAFKVFKEIGPKVAESFAVLGDLEDQELFHDYLILNLKLHMDNFERLLNPAPLEEPEPMIAGDSLETAIDAEETE